MTTVDKITFQQTFPTGNFSNNKLGVEMSLVAGVDDPIEAFEQAKKIVNEAFEKLNPQINWSDSPFDDPSGKPIFSNLGVIIPSETKPRDTVDNIIEDINSCKDEIVLQSYRIIAKKDPRLQEAFDKKLKSFQ